MNSSMPRAARRPAPIARITVAEPVTMSPPAKTPGTLVMPVRSSTSMYPQRFTPSPGVLWAMMGLAVVPRA